MKETEKIELKLAGIWTPQYKCRRCGNIFPNVELVAQQRLTHEETLKAWVHVRNNSGIQKLITLVSLPQEKQKSHFCDDLGTTGVGDFIGYCGDKNLWYWKEEERVRMVDE